MNTVLVYGIKHVSQQVCWKAKENGYLSLFFIKNQLLSRSICSCSKAVYKPVRHIPLLSVRWINSWWWTDELFETCRVSCQNKFVKLLHLIGFIIKKFVTMHRHMNVKFGYLSVLKQGYSFTCVSISILCLFLLFLFTVCIPRLPATVGRMTSLMSASNFSVFPFLGTLFLGRQWKYICS